MTVPILLDHDHTKPIGRMDLDGNELVITMAPGRAMTQAAFLEAFGGAGFIVEEYDGDRIQKVRVLEFSIVGMP